MSRFIVGLMMIFLATEACSNQAPLADAEESIRFRVYLNDVAVGWHTFRLVENGEYLRVSSRMSMDFTVLLVKKVRYRHEAEELWKDGCLHRFKSTTWRDKKVILMNGELENNQFVVNDGDSNIELGECVKSFAYWNPEWLDAKFLLNVENGKYTPVNHSSQRDPESGNVRRTLGLPKTEIFLEYDEDGVWQTLESELKIAGKLKYQLTNDDLGKFDEVF